LVLRRGLALVAGGLVIGVGGALGVTRLIQQQLFNVEPTDPVTFATVTAMFVVVAVAACLVPALRAVRTDPVKALQVE
jgi:ABC-type antimicrobial peptide transport system permease subunit